MAEDRARKYRILLVDDDAHILRAFRTALEDAGYQVESASDGAMALDLIEKERFNTIVSDIQMPNIGGIDLLKAVRAHDRDVPVLLMTGDPRLETAMRAIEHGALRYFVKPVRIAELTNAVEHAVKLHRMALVKRMALEVLGDREMLTGDLASSTVAFDDALETLWMAYQPIVSWSEKRIVGYEALVRSKSAALPHPGALFDAAERLGRVHDVGAKIRACVASDMSSKSVALPIFVNLHPHDLEDDRLYAAGGALDPHAGNIVLEVTERASLVDVTCVRDRVSLLRKKGYRVAIDDLGAGYAGLSSFALLEPDLLKIDMSLVRDVHLTVMKQEIVRSLLSLAKELSMKTIVEGVETAEERECLVGLGADVFQGYLFARPSPPFVGAVF